MQAQNIDIEMKKTRLKMNAKIDKKLCEIDSNFNVLFPINDTCNISILMDLKCCKYFKIESV